MKKTYFSICFFDASPHWSGGAKRVFLLSKELKRRGHHVTVCCLSNSILSQRTLTISIPTEIITPHTDLDPVAFKKVSSIIVRKNIEIIDLCSPKFYWIGSFAGKLHHKKVILTRNVPYRKRGIKKYINRILYNRLVDKVITVSPQVRQGLIEDFCLSDTRVKSIFFGVDLDEYSNLKPDLIRDELKLGSSLLAGVISRLDENKGIEYFLESIPIVLTKIPNIKFLVVGTGKLESKLKSMCSKLSIDKQVVFTGFREDIPQILSVLDITVMPSLDEGLPRTMMESMGAGRPVVATDVGGVKEIISDGVNGILVKPQDKLSLAEGILKLFSSDYKQIGVRAKGTIIEKFSITAAVNQYEQVLSTL